MFIRKRNKGTGLARDAMGIVVVRLPLGNVVVL